MEASGNGRSTALESDASGARRDDGSAAEADGGRTPARSRGDGASESAAEGTVATKALAEALRQRHSVRSYTDRRLEGAALDALSAAKDACNREGDLRFQLVLDEPRAFSSPLARYGKFENVRNYVVLAGRDGADLDERVGYYGERLALVAQTLGLNTCWVGLTFAKRQVRRLVGPGERLVCALTVGYGATPGKPRKSKGVEDVSEAPAPMPGWFRRGVEAALLAPTAVNQQKFRFRLAGERTVTAQTANGPYAHVDLGIAKLHFELGAGNERFAWA